MEQTPWKQEARARAGKKCELRSTSLSLFLCVSLFLFLLSCLSPSHQINPLLESYTKWIRCNYCNIKAQTVQNPPAIRGDWGLIPGSDPWVRKIPWRRKWQPAPVILPGKSHGQRSLAGYNPWGRKELDTIEQLILSLFFVILTTILSVIVKNQKLPRRVKAGLLRTCGSLDDGLPGGSICLPMQKTWVPSMGREDPWEKEMTTHSSILAWRIPWTEEPDGLQSMESQKNWTQLSN